jgi:hypothetical protein
MFGNFEFGEPFFAQPDTEVNVSVSTTLIAGQVGSTVYLSGNLRGIAASAGKLTTVLFVTNQVVGTGVLQIQVFSRTTLAARNDAIGRLQGTALVYSVLRCAVPHQIPLVNENQRSYPQSVMRNHSLTANSIEALRANRSPRARMRNIRWGGLDASDDPDVRPLRPAQIKPVLNA